MQITLGPGVTFDGYWIDYIVEETKRLMHGEFKEHFDNLPDTLENKHLMFCLTDDLLMFCKDKVINLEKVDSDTVADAYTSFKQVNSNAIFNELFIVLKAFSDISTYSDAAFVYLPSFLSIYLLSFQTITKIISLITY